MQNKCDSSSEASLQVVYNDQESHTSSSGAGLGAACRLKSERLYGAGIPGLK